MGQLRARTTPSPVGPRGPATSPRSFCCAPGRVALLRTPQAGTGTGTGTGPGKDSATSP